jgi:tungstate transport system ATP-binding protein
MVFQKPVLLRRSAAANVDFVLRARGKDRASVAELLHLVGLADKATQPARRLSGGEQQCLALARALATEPEVLFLDEPTASLAPVATQIIERIVRDAMQRGVRVIFITHDAGQARRLADDVVFLHMGRVAAHASAAELFSNPPEGVVRDYLNGNIVT